MNFNAFLNSLYIMGEGMIGIFLVTAVLIFSIFLIKKLNFKK